MKTVDIIHPDHGPAHCNEDQLAEFEGLGWKRADAAAKPAAPKAPAPKSEPAPKK